MTKYATPRCFMRIFSMVARTGVVIALTITTCVSAGWALAATAQASTIFAADPPPKGGHLVVTAGNNQHIAVTEGNGGELTWGIMNDGTEAVTIDFISEAVFKWTGEDKDDQPLATSFTGCDPGKVILAADGGFCVVTMRFTTPAVKDTGNEENPGDRGFADLLQKGNRRFPFISGSDKESPFIEAILRGHVEVDDPGVSSITPEPATLSLFTAAGLLIAAGSWRKRKRAPQ